MQTPNIAELFPTPVYVNKIIGSELNEIQDEIKQCIPRINFDKALNEWGKTVQVTSIFEDIIENQNLFHFKRMLFQNIEMYCNSVRFPTRPIREKVSWITKNSKYGYTHVHNHTGCDISGCYYYQTNEKDGDIFFINPCLAASSSYFLSNLPSNISQYPSVGTLILFPGYLLHGVKTNETNEDRISLAFSILFER